MINNWWEYYGDPSIYLHADIPEVQFLRNNNGHEIYTKRNNTEGTPTILITDTHFNDPNNNNNFYQLNLRLLFSNISVPSFLLHCLKCHQLKCRY